MDQTQTTKPKTSPQDFFLTLGATVALYWTVVSVLRLLFTVIDYAFPDIIGTYVDPYSSDIRWTIASLFIVFPLYLWIVWFLTRDAERNPAKRELGVRRWLSYLTLFIAGIVIAVDLIILIQTFLGGEITTRFILKVLSVLVVASGVLGYYVYDLKKNAASSGSKGKYFAWGAGLFVLFSIVIGFIVMGSPQTQRLMRLDSIRVSDLQGLQSQIVYYWQQKEKLPTSYGDLRDPLGGFIPPVDPETGVNYEYKPTGSLSFELCATFALPSRAGAIDMRVPKPALDAAGVYGETWQHGEGHACFERTIDPELYPPLSKTLSE